MKSERHCGGNYSGISIFLPDDKKYHRSSYEDLDFARQTQWDEFELYRVI